MPFRNEIKIKTSNKMEHKFYEWLCENGGKEIHKMRRITSIYFDNDNFRIYEDSIEGIVPRKKIRLRTYNNFNFTTVNDIYLENKFSSIEGRYKTVKKIKNFDRLMFNGFLEAQYGIIKPKIKVDYYRKYFQCNNMRFTLDKCINYTNVRYLGKSQFSRKSHEIIIELKTKTDAGVEDFFNKN